MGLNDPWYNYRVGTQVHASKELNVYQALPTLFLSNDHTGSSELCTLFLDPQWRKRGQWLSAVEITLLIYGRLSRALQ